MNNLAQMQAGWEKYAVNYDDAFASYCEGVARRALGFAHIEKGTSLLDVAAGGGALSIPAAQLGADVLAVDFATSMVDILSSRAEKMGLANLACRIMDGTHLELDDESFDVVCSQFGVMLFPDRLAGMAELARVTRSGGRGIIVAFGSPQRVAFMSLFGRALAAAVPSYSAQPSPMFSLQDPDMLTGEMQAAGYRNVVVHTSTVPMAIDSGEQLWDTISDAIPAVATTVLALDDDQRVAAKNELGQLVRSEYGRDTVELPAEINIGVGTR